MCMVENEGHNGAEGLVEEEGAASQRPSAFFISRKIRTQQPWHATHDPVKARSLGIWQNNNGWKGYNLVHLFWSRSVGRHPYFSSWLNHMKEWYIFIAYATRCASYLSPSLQSFVHFFLLVVSFVRLLACRSVSFFLLVHARSSLRVRPLWLILLHSFLIASILGARDVGYYPLDTGDGF